MSTPNYFNLLFGANLNNNWGGNGNNNAGWTTWNPGGGNGWDAWNPFQEGFGNNFPPYWALLSFWMGGGQWPDFPAIDNGGSNANTTNTTGTTNTGNATTNTTAVSDAMVQAVVSTDGTPITANADLYAGNDEIFVAQNSDTQGHVNKGDILIKANPDAPMYDYDVNGDGIQDKRVVIDGEAYFVISTKAQNDALEAEHGDGIYLPVVDRDIDGDGIPENGYIKVSHDGSSIFIDSETVDTNVVIDEDNTMQDQPDPPSEPEIEDNTGNGNNGNDEGFIDPV